MEDKTEDWKLKFINLPCNEQIYFAQKIALDRQLRKDFLEHLKAKQKR